MEKWNWVGAVAVISDYRKGVGRKCAYLFFSCAFFRLYGKYGFSNELLLNREAAEGCALATIFILTGHVVIFHNEVTAYEREAC